MEQRKGPPIGIDLGTAYTRLAFFDGNNCNIIPENQRNSAMPSYVAFTDSGVLVGEAARAQASQNPVNTIFDVTRLIGRRYSDPAVQNDMRMWPFKLRAGPEDHLLVEVRCRGRLLRFSPTEICSMIMIQIKRTAEKTLGPPITDAVITVPVRFNYEQRQAIKDAGVIAGLSFMQITSAPAAAALCYGMERMYGIYSMVASAARAVFKTEPEEHNMVMFDLGAGTLDVALVTIKGNVCQVRSTAGDIQLGGSDFDKNMVHHFVKGLQKSGHKDVINIPSAVCKLRTFCEKAKMFLSSHDGHCTVPIKINPLCDDVSLDASISEAEFHELNKDLFQKCINIMASCLADAKMSIDNVNQVILAGSATRIPMLHSRISELFNGKEVITSQHLETAAVYGAATQSFFLSAGMSGRVPPLSLVDVAPFSLGLQSPQGEMFVYVHKNGTIPTKVPGTIHSHIPNKSKNCVLVYEGEGRVISQYRVIGKFELPPTHFSSKRRDFNVLLEVHLNGTLIVMVKENSSRTWNTFIIAHNINEDSKGRVWETFVHQESETSIVNASPTKSLTRSGTSRKWDQIRDKKTLEKLISLEKEIPAKIIGQSRNRYVEPKEYAIGIDFGTTYSSVAVWQKNGVKTIENEYGSRLTCSAVAFTNTGRLIGDTIHKEQVTTNPANTIPNIKCLIGRRYSDRSVQNVGKILPFKIICDKKNRPMVSVQYKNNEMAFAPEEIAAMILSKMKEIAEAQLHSKVTKAVISVPASFSDSQRKAIKNAGTIAGLEVMQLLNAPTATAIAYFLQKNCGQSYTEKTLLIFDLGGGNLDISIVAIKGGNIRIQAVAGDTNLGGEDFDNNMVSHFVEKFMTEKRRDIRNKPRSLRRLRVACEKAKRILSTNAQAMVEIDALDEGIDFHSVLTRKAFEGINEELFKRCISCVARCLEDAEMDRNIIDEIVLAGGSTRIPKIQQLLQEFFEGKEICRSINADEAVVYGAAVQATILSGNKNREDFNMFLEDVTAQSLGMANKHGETMNLLIPKYTSIPAKKELILTTCADNFPSFSVQVEECESASSMVFSLSGIIQKLRVKSKISATLEVDISGIVNLTAKEMSSREKNELMITEENGGLTKEEIEVMVESAARYKAEDEEHKERAAELNSLENFAYKMKAIARDAGLSASSKNRMEKAADDAIAWLETNHHAAIHEITTQKEQLEIITSQVRSDALKYLGNIANKIKENARDLRYSALDRKSMEEAADNVIAWIGTDNYAGFDKINEWMKYLESTKSQVPSMEP